MTKVRYNHPTMPKVPLEKRLLNPEQKQAVEFGIGPLLIIAGAGTGKTTVVTERIKHLITAGLAKPSEILALTFTEKAAREMEERVDKAMPYGDTQMWISTFHSFCDRILRAEAIHIGLNSGYQLLTDADATLLLRKNLFTLDLKYFRPLGNPQKFIGAMLNHFSRLKDEDVLPEQYLDWVKVRRLQSAVGSSSEEELLETEKYTELAQTYAAYEKLKVKTGVMDFADLVSQTLDLFRKRSNVLAQYRKQFKFMLVDEFQDTNTAQYELIKLLAPPDKNPNLTVVGDDNQSVYKFRGAAVSNILHFKEDYPQAEQVLLSQNYRSYQYILDAAYKLIKHNDPDTLEAKLGISKKLISTRQHPIKPNLDIGYIHADRVENEADLVAKTIKNLEFRIKNEAQKEKYAWKDFAILVRANKHAEPFVRALTRQGIPFQFLGPAQLFRQMEIKELISYLKVLNNFEDNVAWSRVLSMEFFGISPRDLAALANLAKKYAVSLFEASELLVGMRPATGMALPNISPETVIELKRLVAMVHRHLKLVHSETAGQILYYFLDDTGLIKNILDYKFPLDQTKAENITKFFNKVKSYEAEHEDSSVAAVLDWILLSMELGESPRATDSDWTENDAVNILTVHSAKGLEFPVVFLVNLVGQRFPSTERRETIPIPDQLIKEILPEGDAHLEEERRLFYVGMTRARDELYLTTANFYGEGKRAKKISPFVLEVLGEKVALPKTVRPDMQLSLLDWQKNLLDKPKSAVPLRLTYISYSQLETYRMCPLHYKLRYILKIPTPPSAALSFGASIHATLRDFYELFTKGEEVNRELLFKLFESNWLREGYANKDYERQMQKRGREYLTKYLAAAHSPKTKILLLEQNFTVPVLGRAGYLKIGGKIDRIDDLGNCKIEIIDYKTGKPSTQKDVDQDLQLTIYALAATQVKESPFNRQVQDVVLSMHYLDTQEKISTTRTQTQLQTETEKIISLVHEIEQSDFRCSGRESCNTCEYQMWCGVYAQN